MRDTVQKTPSFEVKTGSFLDGLESMQRQPEAVWLEFNAYAFVCKAKSSPRNLDEIP